MMSECSDDPEKIQPVALCPSCEEKGKPVKSITIESLVKEESKNKNESINDFLFCSNPSCDIAYFSESNEITYNRHDVKIRIGQKELGSSRQVCYCFDHTVEEIEEQVKKTGESTVLNDIKVLMKGDGCKCEIMNPQGGCCLGNVNNAIKEAKLKYGKFTLPQKDKNVMNIGALAQIGAVVSAILASACCWLPLVLLAVGVSGGALSAFFEEWRPVMLPITFILLGVAFYFSYRKPIVLSYPQGDSCCPSEETTKGFTLKKFNKVMLWIVTLLVIGFSMFPNYAGLIMDDDSESFARRENLSRYVVKIEGMTCESCTVHVKSSLKSIPNIFDVNVNYGNKEAVIEFLNSSPSPDKKKILKGIEKIGYKGTFSE